MALERIAPPPSPFDEARAQLAEWEAQDRPGVSLVLLINDDNEFEFVQKGECLPDPWLTGLFFTAAQLIAGRER